MEKCSNTRSGKAVGQEQERYLNPHNFVDKYGVIFRPQGEQNVDKVINIE